MGGTLGPCHIAFCLLYSLKHQVEMVRQFNHCAPLFGGTFLERIQSQSVWRRAIKGMEYLTKRGNPSIQ